MDAAEADGWTALMVACQSASEPCVRALVQAGAAVDAANADRGTALSIAREGSHNRICDLLSLGVRNGLCLLRMTKKKDGLTANSDASRRLARSPFLFIKGRLVFLPNLFSFSHAHIRPHTVTVTVIN
jgi:hypothetical protein